MGPLEGGRMEEGGLRKKKGALGRGLLSSAMWSLHTLHPNEIDGLVKCQIKRGFLYSGRGSRDGDGGGRKLTRSSGLCRLLFGSLLLWMPFFYALYLENANRAQRFSWPREVDGINVSVLLPQIL